MAAAAAFCVILAAATFRCSTGQPVCNVIAPNVRAKCDLEVPPHSHFWPSARVYRSVGHRATLAPPNESCQPISVLNVAAVEGLLATDFIPVEPLGSDSWANTKEGEWVAKVNEHGEHGPSLESDVLLQLDDGRSCALTSISVYQPGREALALRMDFHKCGSDTGGPHTPPHRVSVEVALERAEASGSSGLVEWMCAVLPHSLCWAPPHTTTAPTTLTTTLTSTTSTRTTTRALGRIAVQLDLDYLYVGSGQCHHRGGPPEEHQDVKTVVECAEECVSEETHTIRAHGSTCTGFAFNADKAPHCLVYKTFPVAGQSEPDRHWRCYAVRQDKGRSVGDEPGQPREATEEDRRLSEEPAASLRDAQGDAQPAGDLPRQLRRPPRVALLDLQSELGGRGLLAVRRRLAPLMPDCYEPFDWVTLHGGLQPMVSLNGTAWDLLTTNLPIISAHPADVDSTIVTDHVCVEIGKRGACGQNDELSAVFQTKNEWWEYLLVMTLAAATSATGTAIVMRSCCLPSSRNYVGATGLPGKQEQHRDDAPGAADGGGPGGKVAPSEVWNRGDRWDFGVDRHDASGDERNNPFNTST